MDRRCWDDTVDLLPPLVFLLLPPLVSLVSLWLDDVVVDSKWIHSTNVVDEHEMVESSQSEIESGMMERKDDSDRPSSSRYAASLLPSTICDPS